MFVDFQFAAIKETKTEKENAQIVLKYTLLKRCCKIIFRKMPIKYSNRLLQWEANGAGESVEEGVALVEEIVYVI